MDTLRAVIDYFKLDLPPLKKCCFVLPLTLGVQIFGYISLLDSLVALSALADLALVGDIECAGNAFMCNMMTMAVLVRLVQLGMNIYLVYSVHKAKHGPFALFWAWYNLAVAIFTTLFYRIAIKPIDVRPGWSYSISFLWDLYGSLVAYSYYRKYCDNDEL